MTNKKATAKKTAEIKQGKTAEYIDQESQITPVQVLSDEQLDNTPVVSGTVIFDPSVDKDVIKDQPVIAPEAEDTDHTKDADLLSPEKEHKITKKEQKELVGDVEVKEPTRFGNGKEVIADRIEDTGVSRHQPPSPHGNHSITKNEWPR